MSINIFFHEPGTFSINYKRITNQDVNLNLHAIFQCLVEIVKYAMLIIKVM